MQDTSRSRGSKLQLVRWPVQHSMSYTSCQLVHVKHSGLGERKYFSRLWLQLTANAVPLLATAGQMGGQQRRRKQRRPQRWGGEQSGSPLHVSPAAAFQLEGLFVCAVVQDRRATQLATQQGATETALYAQAALLRAEQLREERWAGGSVRSLHSTVGEAVPQLNRAQHPASSRYLGLWQLAVQATASACHESWYLDGVVCLGAACHAGGKRRSGSSRPTSSVYQQR
jgi:hypothetical protein